MVRSVVMAKKIFSGSQGAGLDPLFYGPNDQLLRSSSELTVFSCSLKQLPMSVRTFSQVVPVFMQSRQADVASMTSGSHCTPQARPPWNLKFGDASRPKWSEMVCSDVTNLFSDHEL